MSSGQGGVAHGGERSSAGSTTVAAWRCTGRGEQWHNRTHTVLCMFGVLSGAGSTVHVAPCKVGARPPRGRTRSCVGGVQYVHLHGVR
jgi:hypothetical protein